MDRREDVVREGATAKRPTLLYLSDVIELVTRDLERE